jgi:hypothetical protein
MRQSAFLPVSWRLAPPIAGSMPEFERSRPNSPTRDPRPGAG